MRGEGGGGREEGREGGREGGKKKGGRDTGERGEHLLPSLTPVFCFCLLKIIKKSVRSITSSSFGCHVLLGGRVPHRGDAS